MSATFHTGRLDVGFVAGLLGRYGYVSVDRFFASLANPAADADCSPRLREPPAPLSTYVSIATTPTTSPPTLSSLTTLVVTSKIPFQ